MNKPAFLVWSLLFTVLSGALIVVVLNVPAFQNALGKAIIGAAVLAALVAIPMSRAAAKQLA